ncbi:MAG: phosphopyruvate hydratase [Chloroflexi bacterium]|nr:phosphopyruvate hydratase [Chloroflexota bacterium]
MTAIKNVRAREILDSRGNPTVFTRVELTSGAIGTAGVPSGASTGEREAWELRDIDDSRMNNKGVLQAVSNVNGTISSLVVGMNADDQAAVDQAMIEKAGENKATLGANATLGVSIAVASAAAADSRQPLYRRFGDLFGIDNPTRLPVPMFNILNGGAHASDSTDFQEFMVFPLGVDNFEDALRAGVEIYANLKSILSKKNYSTTLGDEGGFAPAGLDTITTLDLICEAVEKTPWKLGDEIFFALDVAASELWRKEGHYWLERTDQKKWSSAELIDEYKNLISKYPIASIEDGLDENDWDGWQLLTQEIGDRVQLVGDDLLVTQKAEVEKALAQKSANSVLIKLNQVGTVTETLETMALAHANDWGTVVSHRSGETEDTTIADLAVGTGAGQIKTGAPARGERTAKYNRLLMIGDELGETAEFRSPLDIDRA